jgi:hypothetical protein
VKNTIMRTLALSILALGLLALTTTPAGAMGKGPAGHSQGGEHSHAGEHSQGAAHRSDTASARLAELGVPPAPALSIDVECDNPPTGLFAELELGEGDTFVINLTVTHPQFCFLVYRSTGDLLIDGVTYPASSFGRVPDRFDTGGYQIVVESLADANQIELIFTD